ncbi:MAG: class I SAM-dependent methyltransferase [Solirubrobacterales bacterium]
MPASPTATAEQIKHANTRYHDAAASSYDAKWGIDFGPMGQDQVAGKLRKALGGRPPAPFGDSLEIGAGTGYFSLNLAQLGVIERPTATDISEGMLSTLADTAAELGVRITTVATEAERLPFGDQSFDLVFGHAVLHHIPDLPRALAEFERVLRPGATVAFCGEPSRYGDRLAALPKAGGALLGGVWRRALGAGPAAADARENGDGHELEPEVDVHAFAPSVLRRMLAEAGFESIRVSGEELVANAYGWLLRSLESTAAPDEVPMAWRRFAFRSYIALQRLDTRLFEPRLPAELFYNLVLSARKPA